MQSVLIVILYLVSIFCAVGTILPLIPAGYWWIRIFDFPRAQFFLIALFLLVIFFTLPSKSFINKGFIFHWCVLLSLCFVIVYQGLCMYPFTRLKQVQIEDTNITSQENASLKIIISNVRFDNEQYEKLLKLFKDKVADIVVLSEINDSWYRALAAIKKELKYEVVEIRKNGYGLGVFSRYPLKEAKINFLVSSERPSISTKVNFQNQDIDLWALHPVPPAIPMEEGGRKDSRPRDAELLIVAKKISKIVKPTLVLGDFNDTAWSHTTTLFKKISGLLDPRIGRGFFNSFHTKYPLLRYPIDHVFLSDHFTVSDIQRLEDIGSDHFPMYIEISLKDPLSSVQVDSIEKSEDDKKEANQIIAEGKVQEDKYKNKKEVKT